MKPVEVGKLLGESDRERDAIHIAVLCVQAGETLLPGHSIALVDGVAVPIHLFMLG